MVPEGSGIVRGSGIEVARRRRLNQGPSAEAPAAIKTMRAGRRIRERMEHGPREHGGWDGPEQTAYEGAHDADPGPATKEEW